MNRRRILPPLSALALALVMGAPAPAQEKGELGRMWTFENPPLAYLEKEYGFKPDQAWLNNLRLAALRLGDKERGWCSASFVSPKGLVMTNHHCVRDAIGETQPRNKDWVKNGFYASSLEDEVPLKSEAGNPVWVTQLVGMSTITDKVNAGIEDGDDKAAIKKKRDDNKKKILEEAEKANKDRKYQIVTLYQGAIFQLYEYKIYKDVRLVCAPHLQTAHFGGDPDNFTYPRYSIDFSFVRAYEDGKPADTQKHYFKWKMGGAKEGDLVFIPGNPGSTQRLQTKAQMEYDRDAKNPILKELIDNRLAVYRWAEKNFSQQLGNRLRNPILGLENYQKALGGEQSGLLDKSLMKQKAEAEAAFKAKVNSNPELKQKYGHVWGRLAEIAKEKTRLEPASAFYTFGFSRVMQGAVQLVQALDPDEPEKKRKAIKEAAEKSVGVPLRDDPISMRLFIDHLERARKWLPKDDPYLAKVWGGKDVRAAFNDLRASAVARPDVRKKLLEGGWDAIKASQDPAIVAARELVPIRRKVQKRVEELQAEEETLGVLIGRALFATYGKSVSPDATMTLRFSDGVVKGYEYNGTVAPYRTSFYGLYGRNIDFANNHPFDIPKPWLDRKDKVDMTKSVNFVSTNDIVGGNSGSVVVSKELEVVGLVFDGNIESLPNNYVFRDDKPRSVSVHVDGIMEALKKIYDADRVVNELTGKSQ